MSTRLCLSFEQTPQWFKKNKLLFLFDKSACRVVGDLEYLIRKKFGISSVCHLHLDGYLLPSQESIDIVRDGDSLRVENEPLSFEQDEHTENDMEKSQSKSKKRKISVNTKQQSSKSSSLLAQSLPKDQSTGSPKSTHMKSDFYKCLLTAYGPSPSPNADQASSKNYTSKTQKARAIVQRYKNKSGKGTSLSHADKALNKQKQIKKNPVISSSQRNDTTSSTGSKSRKSSKQSLTKQKHRKKNPASLSSHNATSSSESSSSELSSTESSSSEFSSRDSTESSESSSQQSGYANELSSPVKKTRPVSGSNSSQSSLHSSTLPYPLPSKPCNGKNSSKRRLENSALNAAKQALHPTASKSCSSAKQSSQSSIGNLNQEMALSSNETRARKLPSTGQPSSMQQSSNECVNHSLNGNLSKSITLSARPLDAKHIHFDSDEEEGVTVSQYQESLVHGNIQPLNHSLLGGSLNDAPVLDNLIHHTSEQGATHVQSMNDCNGNIVRNENLIQDKEQFGREKVVDFSTMPQLCGPPRTGDRIAYKILEISASYTPEMSDYKEGVVLAYDPTTREVLVELTPESLVKPLGDGNVSNKFELISGDEDDCEDDVSIKPPPVLERKVVVLWSSMVSPKLISS